MSLMQNQNESSSPEIRKSLTFQVKCFPIGTKFYKALVLWFHNDLWKQKTIVLHDLYRFNPSCITDSDMVGT